MPSESPHPLVAFVSRPVVYRTAIGLYVFLVLALAAISFAVSSQDVRGALYVRGHTELETGRTQGMRGLFHYAPTGETLRPALMDWTLQPVDGTTPAVSLTQGEDIAAIWPDLTLRLPDDLVPGAYYLDVSTTHDKVPALSARAEVEVRPRGEPAAQLQELNWPDVVTRDDNAARRRPAVEAKNETAPVALSLAPGNGELVRGLPSRVFFRVFDEESGAPLPATLDIAIQEGILEEPIRSKVHTDAFGLAYLDLIPVTDLLLQVSIDTDAATVAEVADGEETSEAAEFTLRIHTVAAQFRIAPLSQIVVRGEPVEAVVHSVLGDATYMVDLYDGKRLLQTLSLAMRGGRGGAAFDSPPDTEASPLLRLQSYQSIYGANNGWDSVHVLLVEEDSEEDMLEALRDLYLWIADETDSAHHRFLVTENYLDETLDRRQLTRLLVAGLEEIPRTFELPPVLLNTRQTDREALEIWQEEVKTSLNYLMALLLFGGVLVFLYFVLLGIKRHNREAAMLAEVDLELDDETSLEQSRAIQLERITVAVQGFIVIVTIVAFALGILLVVSYL